MKKSIFSLASILVLVLASGSMQASEPKQGVEYLKTSQPIDISPYKKSVTEIFAYHCPHCYNLEPALHNWKKTKANDVHFEQVPAVFSSPIWIFMAKVFYTSKSLGILDKSHSDFFDALHLENKKLYDLNSVASYFTKFGVSEQKFKDTFNGFQVAQSIRKAKVLSDKSGIQGVPALVINGKYRSGVSMAGSREALFKLADQLTK